MNRIFRSTVSSRGFTLIELLIIVAIIGIIASVSLAPLTSRRIEKELEGAARTFVSVVREAQNYALTGRLDPNDLSRIVCWYGVFGMSGASYSLSYGYRDGSGNCTQTDTSVSYTLGNGIQFASGENFLFELPRATLIHFPYGSPQELQSGSIAVQMTKAGQSHTVCIYPYGRITDVAGASCP